MLKSPTGRLYALFSACKPNDEKVRKRLLLSEIYEMKEYRSLQVNQGAQYVMDKYYSPDILEKLSTMVLKEIKSIIPIIEDCIDKLYSIILYGDIDTLREFEVIDFYSSNSVGGLYDIVANQPQIGFNISNITEIELWDFFDQDTVKSLDGVIDQITETDYENLETIIPEILKDKRYCICCKEINKRRNDYRNRFRKVETQKIRYQISENKAFAVKSFVTLVFTIGMADKMSSTVELGSYRIYAMIIYFFAVIAYWILG